MQKKVCNFIWKKFLTIINDHKKIDASVKLCFDTHLLITIHLASQFQSSAVQNQNNHLFLIFFYCLGHQAYAKGTVGYDKVVGTFGSGILNSEGEVNRRALGTIVFSDEVRYNIL